MLAVSDVNAGLIGATVCLLAICWLIRRLERSRVEQSRPLVPMQSQTPTVWREADGCYGERTDDFVDAGIAAYQAEARKADAEALLAMERRRIMAEQWEAQQAARQAPKRPDVIDVETLEAWYAKQPAVPSRPAPKELGR